MNQEPSLKVILWTIKNQQRDIAEAIALHGYSRFKPLVEILMELSQKCR